MKQEEAGCCETGPHWEGGTGLEKERGRQMGERNPYCGGCSQIGDVHVSLIVS